MKHWGRIFGAALLLITASLAHLVDHLYLFWIAVYTAGIWEIISRKPRNIWSTILFIQWSGIFLLIFFSFQLTIFLAVVIFANDTAAYFGGSYLNFCSIMRKKLSPKASPKKTWGGLFYRLLAAVISGLAFNFFWPLPFKNIAAYSFGVALIGNFGDYLESKFKRNHEIKDSGQGLFTSYLAPGHGGICDRFDALSLGVWGWIFLRMIK